MGSNGNAERERERKREKEREREKKERERERETKNGRGFCHELEKGKTRSWGGVNDHKGESCGAAPKNGGEAVDTKDAVRKCIEANLRKVDILRQMRRFISNLD